MTKMMTQVELRQKKGSGHSIITCWLDADPRIKEGKQVTIDEEDGWWTIHKVYSTMDRAEAPTKWDAGGVEGKRINK